MAAQTAGPASPSRRGGASVTLSLTAIAVAVVAAIMSAAALGLGQAGRAPAPAAAAPVVPNGQSRLSNVELGDMFVRPSSVSVPYGTKVVLHVVNHGAMSQRQAATQSSAPPPRHRPPGTRGASTRAGGGRIRRLPGVFRRGGPNGDVWRGLRTAGSVSAAGSGQPWPPEQWPPQYGHPGPGQQEWQGGTWQREQYDPGSHRQRLGQPPYPLPLAFLEAAAFLANKISGAGSVRLAGIPGVISR